MDIPELSDLLKGSVQNTILLFLYAVGAICHHLPKKVVDSKYVPAIVLVSSVLITPFFITPYRDAFVYSFMYAAIEIIGYAAYGERVENWIKKKFVGGEEEVQVAQKPFKQDPARIIPVDPNSQSE